MRRVVSVSAVALCVMAPLGGCGRSDLPPMAPVTGTVTVDGRPVEGATVLFHPTSQTDQPGATRPGAGTCDDNGQFQITTFRSGDGGLIGTHKVTVSKAVDPSSASPGNVFAWEYVDLATTPLTAEVTADGDNVFAFDVPANRGEPRSRRR